VTTDGTIQLENLSLNPNQVTAFGGIALRSKALWFVGNAELIGEAKP
jgi:hypothetical protein